MPAITDTQPPVGDNGIDLWCKGRGVSVKQGGSPSRALQSKDQDPKRAAPVESHPNVEEHDVRMGHPATRPPKINSRGRGRPRHTGHHSKRWTTNKITVAPSGSSSPARRLPVECEMTPTIQGMTAGPTAASENRTAPILRAATPKRCERRATVMGYKVAKLSPVISAPPITPASVGAHSIRPMPAAPAP